MGNKVTAHEIGRKPPSEGLSLFTRTGARKYLTRAEQQRVIVAFEALPPHEALFGLTLAATGARISEILALTPAAVQVDEAIVTLRTLKRRRLSLREVPVPTMLMTRLADAFALENHSHDSITERLWPFSRTKAWRIIKAAMSSAGITGRSAMPRGLRHGFGVGTLQAGVPITLVQRWLGHARLSTTAIYAEVSGPEERALAGRYWNWLDDKAAPNQTPTDSATPARATELDRFPKGSSIAVCGLS